MNPLVVVLSSQLLYYLLIAQTGIVGVFDSQFHALYTLPLGGILGSVLAAYLPHTHIKRELFGAFVLQFFISLGYPHYSLVTLLLLGLSIGYTTPLLLFVFAQQSRVNLAFGLALSYAIGTALYTYPFHQRGVIAILLPTVSLIAWYFSPIFLSPYHPKRGLPWKSIGAMMVWIFADSALFETLSRSEGMDIWGHYTLLIILSHLLGIYGALVIPRSLIHNTPLILGLFFLSYLAYYTHQGVILAIVYPIVISYYNVLLFRELTQMGEVRIIAWAMVGVGWCAASVANVVALTHHLWIVVLLLGVLAALYPFYFRRIV